MVYKLAGPRLAAVTYQRRGQVVDGVGQHSYQEQCRQPETKTAAVRQ